MTKDTNVNVHVSLSTELISLISFHQMCF